MKTFSLATLFVMATLTATTFAQTFVGAYETSGFRDKLKCEILDLDYKHFIFLGINSDKNSYFAGETTNQDQENPYQNYTQIESYISASSQSYTSVNYRTDDTRIYTDWKFRGNNFSLNVRISNEGTRTFTAYFDSKLNPKITKSSGAKVRCYYVR